MSTAPRDVTMNHLPAATAPSTSTIGTSGDASLAASAGAGPTKTAAAGPSGHSPEVISEASGVLVDMEVFGQLLEIDDDESHEFSRTLAFDYISQAETTFQEFEAALQARDLDGLSRKGHFLKGSSAALGLQRVQHSCEAMQHFGNRRDEHGEGPLLSEDDALNRCRTLLLRLRKEQKDAKDWLEAFYRA